MKKRNLLFFIGLILVMITIMGGCTSQSFKPTPTPLPASKIKKVDLQGGKYFPETLYIQTGEMVQWVNNCCTGCTVTSDNDLFDSGSIKKGQSYSFTFEKSGIYHYHCMKIEDMRGIIIVE